MMLVEGTRVSLRSIRVRANLALGAMVGCPKRRNEKCQQDSQPKDEAMSDLPSIFHDIGFHLLSFLVLTISMS